MAKVARWRVTLGELLAVLSLGVDIGFGQPMEHMFRQCVIAMGLAEFADLGAPDVELLPLISLLAFVGCHADSYEQAHWFGDDIGLRAGTYAVDLTPRNNQRYVMSLIGAGQPRLQRARTFANFMRQGRHEMEGMRVGHCFVAGQLATKLGLRDDVSDALPQVFERWDGDGDPGVLAGPDITLPVRLVQLADVAEVSHREGGVDAAVEMARARRGTQFDPEVVDLFCDNAPDVLAPVAEPADWESVVSAAPRLSERLSDDDTSVALEAVADHADLKSPYTLGHSRAVADLAAEAARVQGLPADQVHELRTAGLLHDLGRFGVSNRILDKHGPLTMAERERVRLRPYLTDRMLSASPALAPLAALASATQERIDGSGYPRGLRGDALSPAARTLAAADVYQAMREPRPHREALSATEAAGQLRDEARAGRLDGDAVETVLGAAGHPTSRRPARPGDLTAREVEVLGLLARGLQSKEIAQRLVITRKTVDHHIGHIYLKIGASNRVAASLFATEHGLLGPELEASQD